MFQKVCISVLIIALIFNCKEAEKPNFQTIDYLKVSQIQDSLNVRLKEDFYGNWLKYGTFKNSFGNKTLVFVGCSHVQDSTHPQFKIMKNLFQEIKPEIALNEGGDWHIKGKYKSENEAIINDGEVGLLQYLCDIQKIDMVNGDMKEAEEYQKMFSLYPFEKVYLLFSIERFVNPYRQGAYATLPIERAFYEKFVIKQLKENGIKVSTEQQNFTYFKKIYQKHFKKPFNLNDLEPVWDYYLLNKGEFGRIHRKSKEIRDAVLLTNIDSALNIYDRVFVAFGASHLQALKPALNQIINKKR